MTAPRYAAWLPVRPHSYNSTTKSSGVHGWCAKLRDPHQSHGAEVIQSVSEVCQRVAILPTDATGMHYDKDFLADKRSETVQPRTEACSSSCSDEYYSPST